MYQGTHHHTIIQEKREGEPTKYEFRDHEVRSTIDLFGHDNKGPEWHVVDSSDPTNTMLHSGDLHSCFEAINDTMDELLFEGL